MAKETPTKKKNKKSAAASSAKANAKAVKAAARTKAAKPVAEITPAEPVMKADKKSASDARTPVGKLARWYKWLGLLLFAEGLAVVVLNRSVTAPVTLQYPAIDALASESTGHQVLGLASRHLADVHVGWMVATFLIVFAAINLMQASAYRKYLDTVAQRGVNAFRSLALGLGGGVMVATIGMVSGISSLPLLLAMAGAVFVGSLLGLGAEVVVANNGGVKTRFAHFLCSVAMISSLLPWLVFGLAILGANLWDGNIPGFLYSIYACQFVLFGAILLAMHYRLKRQGKWADALYSDRGFLYLSFIAATLLAAQVFAGVLK